MLSSAAVTSSVELTCPVWIERGELVGGPEEKVVHGRSAEPTRGLRNARATAAVKECSPPPGAFGG